MSGGQAAVFAEKQIVKGIVRRGLIVVGHLRHAKCSDIYSRINYVTWLTGTFLDGIHMYFTRKEKKKPLLGPFNVFFFALIKCYYFFFGTPT